MNKLTFVTAAVAVCAAAAVVVGPAAAQALAQEKTRAEVIAELAQARSDGVMQALYGEDSGSFYLSQQPVEWTQTREAVQSATTVARHTGELMVLASECGCGMNPSQPQPTIWQADASDGVDAPGPQGCAALSTLYAGPDAAPSAEREFAEHTLLA